jgi:carbonyl reductase 1
MDVFSLIRRSDPYCCQDRKVMQGIGYEIARILAEQGFTVAVAARNPELGNAAVAKLTETVPGGKLDFFQLDITDENSAETCAKQVKEAYGKVDILINNAGMAYKGNIFGADEAATTINCNLKGTRNATEAFLSLIGHGGRVVNVCSR